jgi:hypothetical protein
MEPLDLTATPPRGPREKLAGLIFMPRTIDKLRAEQPGGNLGVFLNRPDGLSAFMCRRLGIDMEELRAVVAEAPDEAAVAAWLTARVTPDVVAETNAKLETMSITRLPPERQAEVKERHPILDRRPDLEYFLDIFEADEVEADDASRAV